MTLSHLAWSQLVEAVKARLISARTNYLYKSIIQHWSWLLHWKWLSETHNAWRLWKGKDILDGFHSRMWRHMIKLNLVHRYQESFNALQTEVMILIKHTWIHGNFPSITHNAWRLWKGKDILDGFHSRMWRHMIKLNLVHRYQESFNALQTEVMILIKHTWIHGNFPSIRMQVYP